MDTRIFVGTESGLFTLRGDTLEPVEKLAARDVTALAREAGRTWVIVDGRSLWSGHDGRQRDTHQPGAVPRRLYAVEPERARRDIAAASEDIRIFDGHGWI